MVETIETPNCVEVAQSDPASGERQAIRLFRDGPALVWRGAVQNDETCLWSAAKLSADDPQGPGELQLWHDRESPCDMTGAPDETHPIPTLRGRWRGIALLPVSVGQASEQEIQ